MEETVYSGRRPEQLDLHMHTTVSDGTDTPEELLAHVREKGIELFSVTDHDAVKGCLELRRLRREGDPLFLPGVEFSCRDEEGKYHILGYGFDPEAEPIRRVVDTGHQYRMQKVQDRLRLLETEFGFGFSEEDLRAILSMDNPGKPHIGNMMVRYGYAGTKEEAINNYINRLRVKPRYVRPEEAIAGILGAGGIPVLAHPSFGSGDQIIVGEEMEHRLRRLMDYGLQGVEAYYSGFSGKLRSEILAFAGTFGLLVTAGSDYHGRNKLVELGDTGLARASEGAEGLQRFLDKACMMLQ